MKSLILILLFISSSSFAQRNVYDLMYLPEEGMSFGTSALSFTEGKIRDREATLAQSGYKFIQSIGHSFTSRLLVSAEMNYFYSKNDYRYSVPSPSDATYEKGFSDPGINAKYRLLENNLTLDFLGGLVIDSGNSHIENNRKKNNKQGGPSYKAGLQFGQKISTYQWSFLAQIERFGKSHLKESRSTYGKSSDEAHTAYQVRTDLLKTLTEKSILRFFILSKIASGFTSNNNIHYDAVTFFELGPEYQFMFSKNLLAKVGVSYSTITSSPASYDLWNLNLGSTYQF